MADYDDGPWDVDEPGRPADPAQGLAREVLLGIFQEDPTAVFYSRQLEVRLEDRFFHWITNRALRGLAAERIVSTETRTLPGVGSISLYWHQSNRYYRRRAKRVVSLVREYSDPLLGHALGYHGELLVLEAFARHQFVLLGRNTREHRGHESMRTGHELDLVFERDGVAYGLEVKNTLRYMPRDEFDAKVLMCKELGLRPVFVVRMLPKAWIIELDRRGGFALILKYQFYPPSHLALAQRVAQDLGLPVSAPRALADGTMVRFLRWHDAHRSGF